MTAGLAVVVYGIVLTERSGWSAPATLLPLAGGVLLLAVFVTVEARTKAPLMPLVGAVTPGRNRGPPSEP